MNGVSTLACKSSWNNCGPANTETFNCQELPLTLDDIKLLEEQIKEGYPDYECEGGFLGASFRKNSVPITLNTI